MFNWNKNKNEVIRLTSELNFAVKSCRELTSKHEACAAELETLKKEDHQGSTTPWFLIETTELDPVKGLQIKMDWNEAMPQYLKDNGHTGRDEEVLIQKWLAMLYEDIISQLEQKIIDLNTEHKDQSEFE